MSESVEPVLLRTMTLADLPDVVNLQESAERRSLAEISPGNTHRFPREQVAQDWIAEIATPGINCLVVQLAGSIIGFAAILDDEFLHFGIAAECWGTGIATAAHDAVLDRMHAGGAQRVWLRVFAGNGRARRFYEKLGWHPTGQTSNSPFPPYQQLTHYELHFGRRTRNS